MRDTKVQEDHAVLAARTNGHWIILDNRWLALAEDIAFPRYTPLFAINGEGVRRFVGG